MEGELINTLEEIDRIKKNNKKQKELLNMKKEECESKDSSLLLPKVEFKEAKRIEDILLQQPKEKGKECENLEEEVDSLRKEFKKN